MDNIRDYAWILSIDDVKTARFKHKNEADRCLFCLAEMYPNSHFSIKEDD